MMKTRMLSGNLVLTLGVALLASSLQGETLPEVNDTLRTNQAIYGTSLKTATANSVEARIAVIKDGVAKLQDKVKTKKEEQGIRAKIARWSSENKFLSDAIKGLAAIDAEQAKDVADRNKVELRDLKRAADQSDIRPLRKEQAASQGSKCADNGARRFIDFAQNSMKNIFPIADRVRKEAIAILKERQKGAVEAANKKQEELFALIDNLDFGAKQIPEVTEEPKDKVGANEIAERFSEAKRIAKLNKRNKALKAQNEELSKKLKASLKASLKNAKETEDLEEVGFDLASDMIRQIQNPIDDGFRAMAALPRQYQKKCEENVRQLVAAVSASATQIKKLRPNDETGQNMFNSYAPIAQSLQCQAGNPGAIQAKRDQTMARIRNLSRVSDPKSLYQKAQIEFSNIQRDFDAAEVEGGIEPARNSCEAAIAHQDELESIMTQQFQFSPKQLIGVAGANGQGANQAAFASQAGVGSQIAHSVPGGRRRR